MNLTVKLTMVTGLALTTLGLTMVSGLAAPRRHRRVGHAAESTTTTTTTTLSGGSSTTTTTLRCSPTGFDLIDSALGALLNEVNEENLSARLHTNLVHQEKRTRMLVDQAAVARCDKQGHKAGELLKAAIRAMISFEYRVRSLAGRHGGANATKLLHLADAVIKALGDARGK